MKLQVGIDAPQIATVDYICLHRYFLFVKIKLTSHSETNLQKTVQLRPFQPSQFIHSCLKIHARNSRLFCPVFEKSCILIQTKERSNSFCMACSPTYSSVTLRLFFKLLHLVQPVPLRHLFLVQVQTDLLPLQGVNAQFSKA